MILIIAEDGDYSSLYVTEWLHYYDYSYMRINSNELSLNFISLDNLNNEFNIKFRYKNKDYTLKDFNVIWFRRGYLRFSNFNFSSDTLINDYLVQEYGSLKKSLYRIIFSNSITIGLPTNYQINKLEILNIVKNFKINIPKTAILSSKKDLKNFICKNTNGIITKGIQEGVNDTLNNFNISSGTELFDENLKNISTYFAPTLFQENLDKKFEIRIFYFMKQFYSMAIFSQSDIKTKIDFRNYNDEKPNRMIPFNIPKSLKMKIIKFMDFIELKTGSLDFVYTQDDQFVFLEVNPVGQFDFVSKKCNFYIEKKIANLMHEI